MLAELLEELDPTQQAAVTSPAQPLALLAGAGSGKTRVLTSRVAWRANEENLNPTKTVAVTFTRKAATELQHRLGRLGITRSVTTGTFHSLAYAQLHQRWDERGIRPPELLTRKIGLVARLLPSGVEPLDATAELEWASARALTAETYPRAIQAVKRTPPMPVEQMMGLLGNYKNEKRRRRLVDYDDLLWLSIRDLQDTEFCERVRSRFAHFFVDEFQDINPLQFNLLSAWLGGRKDLCVVGDPNQAIYGWNGADASYLRWFNDRFAGGTTLKLGFNYRSTRQIVAAGHAVLPSNSRKDDPPNTQSDGPKPQILAFPTYRDEAEGVTDLLQKAATDGIAWSDQAVLVRTNAQTAEISAACQRCGIPTRVRGGAGLTNQPEVQQLLTSLQKQSGPLSDALNQLTAQVERYPLDTAAEQDRQRNRLALLQIASDQAASVPDMTVARFVNETKSLAAAGDVPTSADAVDITTFHAAKGLEWSVVHIMGMERGLVPIGYAETAAALAEERRLLHVAITRAKQRVNFTWAAERRFGQTVTSRTRSPYLDIFDPPPLKPKKKPAPKFSSPKGDLPENDPLYVRLVEWRRTVAKNESMPAYVVLNNRTAAAIVRDQPTNKVELLAVPGIGPAKVDKYGDDILDILEQSGR